MVIANYCCVFDKVLTKVQPKNNLSIYIEKIQLATLMAS